MEDLHIDIESEYLVELATLIEYKSKKLLPKKPDELDDDYKSFENPTKFDEAPELPGQASALNADLSSTLSSLSKYSLNSE